jgi:hypothetical protein
MHGWEELATPEEKVILDGPCSGPDASDWRCWYNPDTGYMEYCPVHESVIADICFRKKNGDI